MFTSTAVGRLETRPATGVERVLAATILVIGTLVAVELMWGIGFRPQDGPNHVQSAASWLAVQHGDAPTATTQATSTGWEPYPYVLSFYLLAGLGEFVSWPVAEMLVAIGTTVGLTVGLTFFLRSRGWTVQAAAALSLPLSWTFVPLAGFYAFNLGAAFAFAALACAGSTGRRRFCLSVLTLLMWLAHLIPYLLVLGYDVVRAVLDRETRSVRSIAWIAVRFVPLLAWVAYVPDNPVPAGPWEPLKRLVSIVTLDAFMVAYTSAERLLVLGAAVALVAGSVMLLWVRASSVVHDPMVVVGTVAAAGLVVLGVVVPPEVSSGSYVHHRFGYFAFVLLVGVLGRVAQTDRRMNSFAGAWAMALFAALCVVRLPAMQAIGDAFDDASTLAAEIHDDDVVATFVGTTEHVYLRAYPTDHVAADIALRSEATYLSNIVTHNGEAPLRYRSGFSATWLRDPGDLVRLQLTPTVIIVVGHLEADQLAEFDQLGYALEGEAPAGAAQLLRHR